MTYNVLMGMLNPTHSHSLTQHKHTGLHFICIHCHSALHRFSEASVPKMLTEMEYCKTDSMFIFCMFQCHRTSTTLTAWTSAESMVPVFHYPTHKVRPVFRRFIRHSSFCSLC